ncbi:hypothetical protein [Chryseolinea serpens]|nr:hypothetical protein [Chryseolinea serpens]
MTILRLKHWQVFLLAWGPHAISMLQLMLAPETVGATLPLWLLVVTIGTTNCFIWAWKIMAGMNQIYPAANILAFKIAFWIPCISTLTFVANLVYDLFFHKREPTGINSLAFWIGTGILSSVCILFGLMLIGRMVRAVELKRTPLIGEHLFESLIMLIPPVGVWIVQPRLNRILASQEASKT